MKNIILLNLALVCCFISFVGGKYSSDLQTESKLEKVVNWNTKQIHSLGIVAATDSYNAEVMIQILNLIEGREIKPPVRETISEMITSDESIEDDDVPHTFEQVAKDQREVDQSIRAFGSANLFQAETLENILNKLQGGNYLQ
jgi:hypothetical protein